MEIYKLRRNAILLDFACIAVAMVVLYLASKQLLPQWALITGAVIGLEFALDRTTWNKLLIYAAMIIVVAIPAVLGMILLKTNGEKNN